MCKVAFNLRSQELECITCSWGVYIYISFSVVEIYECFPCLLVVNIQYSEDLFLSDDDDDFLDDGLTEPEILAMLDEAECKF